MPNIIFFSHGTNCSHRNQVRSLCPFPSPRFPFESPPFPLQLSVATSQAWLNGLSPQESIYEMSLIPYVVPIRTARLLYHCCQSDCSPFSASCPICGKELLPNKVASHIRHGTNSSKGNMSTDQQETDLIILCIKIIYFKVTLKAKSVTFLT